MIDAKANNDEEWIFLENIVFVEDGQEIMRMYETLSEKELKDLYHRTTPGQHAKCDDCPMKEFCEKEVYDSCAETLWWYLFQEVKE